MSSDPAAPPADRRAQILDCAEAAFGECGFAGARIEDIATRAGLRRPSLLHHFRDKRTLYGAVVVRIVADLSARVADTDDDEGLARMERVVGEFVAFVAARPDAARILLRLLVDPIEVDGVATAVARLLETLQRAIDAGVARGENKPRDAAEVALALASTALVWVAARRAVADALGMDTLAAERVEALRSDLRQLARQLLGAVTASDAHALAPPGRARARRRS
ncbi:MAG: TetR/AcrR family transcriptional regulator [Myxococcota bacterium]